MYPKSDGSMTGLKKNPVDRKNADRKKGTTNRTPKFENVVDVLIGRGC